MNTIRVPHLVAKEVLREKARLIRLETLRMTDVCGSGHYGSSFSMAEIVAVLYHRFMHVRPSQPQWPDRDRFTMGKGHAAIGLFPVLADLGFFPQSWLDSYTRFKSPLGDHPDMKKVPGVDFSSGSIGHNLSVSVGMALGTRRRGSPARTVCLMGDGEQTEGQIWEAAISGAHWGLDNLVGIVDINAAGSDGDHPDMKKVPGVDFSSGSIGHNLSVSVGMALGTRRRGSPARTVCLMGDGEQTEGQIWEAAISGAHWGLDNLVGIVDINAAGSDGDPQETMKTEPLKAKWEAFGWRTLVLEDGHDLDAVSAALNVALNQPDGRPTCILAYTVSGKGVSFMEHGWQWHLGFLGPKDLQQAYREVLEGSIG